MKNPVPALANTEENREELEKITPEIWDKLTDNMKLGRIALHESLKKSNLLKIKYDKDKIIKTYNKEKNLKSKKRAEESISEEYKKKIDNLKVEKSKLEEERNSLQEENNKLRENNEILEKNYNIINTRYNRALKKIEDQESLLVSCNESKEKHKENSKILKEKIDIQEMEISKSREFETSVKSDVQIIKNEINRLNNEMSQFKIETDHLASNFRNVMSVHSLTSYKNNIIEQGIRSVFRKIDQNSLNRKEIDALRQELNELIFIGNFTSNVQC